MTEIGSFDSSLPVAGIRVLYYGDDLYFHSDDIVEVLEKNAAQHRTRSDAADTNASASEASGAAVAVESLHDAFKVFAMEMHVKLDRDTTHD